MPLAAQICNKDALLDAELQREEAVQRRKQEEAEAAEDEFKPPDPQVNVRNCVRTVSVEKWYYEHMLCEPLCCFVC